MQPYSGTPPAVDPLAAIRRGLASAGGGDPSVSIAIIDGLPDLAHPALAGARIDTVAAMVPPGGGRADLHGTQVCSIIFGNGAGALGLAPHCSGLVLPIFFGRDDGRVFPASQIDLARALAFAVERGADIINVSAGQKTVTAEAETHLAQSLARCRETRRLVVAAAGNDGCACIHLPAAVDHVLAVGALGPDGRPLATSNWGEPYRRNGLLAPGAGIAAAATGGGTARVSGTSFATAVISATAALLLTLARRHGYAIDAADIRDILIETAAPCELPGDGACDRHLAGTLDAAAALAALHRAGSAGRPAIPGTASGAVAEARPVPASDITFELGETVMTSRRFRSDARAAAVLPSACSCESQTAGDEGAADADEHEEVEDAARSADPDTADDRDDGEAGIVPQGRARRPASGRNARAISGSMSGTTSPARILQQGCGCGGNEPPQIVFVLGALWFDFGTEARYDAIVQQMGDPVAANNPLALIAFLRDNMHFASGITFILMQDQIPLYAVQPAGPFALDIYTVMLRALESCLDESGKEQRVSLPGVISGSTRLMNGMTVPVVYPDRRGMYQWNSKDLVEATRVAMAEMPAAMAAADDATDDEILNFLNRVYYELRNLGVSPQERALNFAATNAYQSRQAFADAAARHLALESINVAKSPICRPDSDCWDVQLTMFDPENERRANRTYRYTVDVSEVLPVTVGPVRTWASRA